MDALSPEEIALGKSNLRMVRSRGAMTGTRNPRAGAARLALRTQELDERCLFAAALHCRVQPPFEVSGDDTGMDIALAAHGPGVAQLGSDGLNRARDIALAERRGLRWLERAQRP